MTTTNADNTDFGTASSLAGDISLAAGVAIYSARPDAHTDKGLVYWYEWIGWMKRLGGVVGWCRSRVAGSFLAVLYWPLRLRARPGKHQNQLLKKPAIFFSGFRYDFNRGRHFDRKAA